MPASSAKTNRKALNVVTKRDEHPSQREKGQSRPVPCSFVAPVTAGLSAN
jgi:hypothetical protein